MPAQTSCEKTGLIFDPCVMIEAPCYNCEPYPAGLSPCLWPTNPTPLVFDYELMKLPILVFRLLVGLPFVGSALRRSPDEIEEAGFSIRIPTHWFIDAMIRLVLCLAFIGFGTWFLIDKLRPAAKAVVTQSEFNQAILKPEVEFDEFLKNCEREQLFQWLKQIDDNAGDSIMDRRLSMKNRAAAANKLGLSRMGGYRIFGIAHELDLRSELALFDLGNNQFYRDSILELNEVSKLQEGIEHPEQNGQTQDLKTRARIGDFISKFIEAVEASPDGKSTPDHEQLFSKLRNIAEKSFVSKELEELLMRLSKLTRPRLQHLNKATDISDDLESELVSMRRSNHERVMSEFQSIEPKKSTATRFDYKDESESQDKDRFLVEFESKLNRVLKTQELGADDYSEILDKLRDLAFSGWARSSKRIMNQVLATAENVSPTLKLEADQLRSQIDWIGEPLDVDDVRDQTDKPVRMGSGLADATMVLYLPQLEEIQKPDAKFMQMVSTYNSLASNNKIRFVVVLVHQEQENIFEKIAQLNQQLKPLEFYCLDGNSPGGQKFLTTIPMDKLSYLVILDSFNYVISINPLPQQVVGVVNKLKSKDR